MSEPILERLSRFTPDAGRLDRDALMFAAGRASARPNRGWITLAGVLAGTQALMLAVLWVHLTSPVTVRGVWSVHSLKESELEDRPDETVTLIESEPPLRAFSPPSAILN